MSGIDNEEDWSESKNEKVDGTETLESKENIELLPQKGTVKTKKQGPKEKNKQLHLDTRASRRVQEQNKDIVATSTVTKKPKRNN